jgi:hypothetical protein
LIPLDETGKKLFQRKKSKCPKNNEKMLAISGHKGNAKQNHTKIPLTSIRIAIIKTNNNNKCW